jgi:hypothetical protein
MGRLFTGMRASSTLGTFLRAFTFGHVRQLDKGRRRGVDESGPAKRRCFTTPTG